MRCDRPALPLTWSTDRAKFEIRRANLKDLQALAEILTCCFHITNLSHQWLSPILQIAISEDLRQRLRSTSPYYACWIVLHHANLSNSVRNPLSLHHNASLDQVIASQSNEPCVIATVEMDLKHPNPWCPNGSWQSSTQLNASAYMYLSNLAVRPEFRRQGIARRLLEVCEQTAKNWGFQDMYLHVLDNNPNAQRLYAEDGYELQKVEGGWDVLLFRRPKRLLLHKQV